MTGEEREDVINAKNNLYDGILKDEDRFEVKITAISSGAIALIMTFVATRNDLVQSWTFWLGIGLTGGALIMNMILYMVCKRWMRTMIDRFDNDLKEDIYPKILPNDQLVNHSKRVDVYNLTNLCLMITGISFLIIFVFNNI